MPSTVEIFYVVIVVREAIWRCEVLEMCTPFRCTSQWFPHTDKILCGFTLLLFFAWMLLVAVLATKQSIVVHEFDTCAMAVPD
jgi:hypothetical protein